jgi:Secretion system C-terminal sorting domain
VDKITKPYIRFLHMHTLNKTFLFMLLPMVTQGQVAFERTYGGNAGDVGFSVEQTADGGYILAGATESSGAGSFDMYLMKVDPLGNEVWSKTFGTPEIELAYSVQQLSDGGYILCGGWAGFGSDSLTLIRTNATGDPEWIAHYPISVPRSIGYSVQETSDGGFVACGFSGPQDSEDMVVLKTDGQGVIQWTRTVDLGQNEVGYAVRETADHDLVVLGLSFINYGVDGDMLLVRLDQAGNTLWTRPYPTAENEEGHGLSLNSDGGFTITARKWAVSADLFLMRTNSVGDTLWTRTFGSELGDDEGFDVEQTPNGDFVVTGRYQEAAGEPAGMYLIRTDGAGDLLWERKVFNGVSAISQSVDLTSDGGYVMLGYTVDVFGADGNIDMFLVKTDGAGYTSIAEAVSDSDRITLFPNPADDVARFSMITDRTGPLAIIVVDASGRMVRQERVGKETVHAIDCSGLDNGVYSVLLKRNNGAIAMSSLVVSH